MKGVILSIAPRVRLVDVTHRIAPQDVMEGAYVLRGVSRYYPDGTVHLAVVDPDVGTERLPVALSFEGQYYVGPDNGLFSLLLGGSDADEIVVLNRPDFWRTQRPSSTFNGRDIFAPAAAHIARGRTLKELGSVIRNMRAMHWALPIADEQGIQGWVVHTDRFGNCITNISREIFETWQQERPFKCYVGTAIMRDHHPTYAAVTPGDPVLLFNSSDYLEIAIYRGDATEMLDVRKGASVNIVFIDKR